MHVILDIIIEMNLLHVVPNKMKTNKFPKVYKIVLSIQIKTLIFHYKFMWNFKIPIKMLNRII